MGRVHLPCLPDSSSGICRWTHRLLSGPQHTAPASPRASWCQRCVRVRTGHVRAAGRAADHAANHLGQRRLWRAQAPLSGANQRMATPMQGCMSYGVQCQEAPTHGRQGASDQPPAPVEDGHAAVQSPNFVPNSRRRDDRGRSTRQRRRPALPAAQPVRRCCCLRQAARGLARSGRRRRRWQRWRRPLVEHWPSAACRWSAERPPTAPPTRRGTAPGPSMHVAGQSTQLTQLSAAECAWPAQSCLRTTRTRHRATAGKCRCWQVPRAGSLS